MSGDEHTQEPDAVRPVRGIAEAVVNFLARINKSRFPVVISLLIIFSVNAYLVTVQLTSPAPQNPWESGQLTDAWRFAQGQGLYSPAQASQNYGPLAHAVIGETFKFTGPNLYAGRILSLIASIVTVTLLAWVVAEAVTSFYFWVSWVFLFGVNIRAINYFVDTRPDAMAIMFALLALILFYRNKLTLGACCLVVGFLFKQVVIIASVIPLVAFCFERQKITVNRALRLAALIMVVPVIIAVIRWRAPLTYYFMITVLRQYPVPSLALARTAVDLLATIPLFFVALALWIQNRGGNNRLALWLLASVVVTVPSCIVFMAKAGGSYNSLLPALFAMMGFACYAIRRMPDRMHGLTALLACVTIFAHLGPTIRVAKSTHGDKNYPLAIQAASSLRGNVICPEDPFLIVLARKEAKSSIFLEQNEEGWREDLPSRTTKELATADYLIQVRNTPYPYLTDDRLLAKSFTLKEMIGNSYAVWERQRPVR